MRLTIRKPIVALCCLLIFLAASIPAMAQNKVTLSGYVKDAESGESLINAAVYVKESGLGCVTNSYGFYSITVPAGNYTVLISYVGYSTKDVKMELSSSKSYTAELAHTTDLKEVQITSRKDANVKNTEMGTITLTIDKIKALPVLFGETDILKTLQLLPGVQSAGEGSSGFYVRGGGPDQNLVLLDEAVVYNTGHLFGFFSIFNSDAIKDVTLIKGGMPANYGGRLSSVVDISMKEGNMKEYHAEGGIGLISSRLMVQGPIKKDKGSFMISGRRTYIDVLLKPFIHGRLAGSGYYFYDVNLKANYILSDKDRVFLSGYIGLDKFNFNSPNSNFSANIPWGNKTATVRWNHEFSNKAFINTSYIYNDYNFAANFNQSNFAIKIASGIKDHNLKSDLDYYTSNNNHLKVGINYTYHTFIPNQISGQADTIVLKPNNALIKYAHEVGVYVMDEFDPYKWLRINAGIRYSWFGQIGPYTKYTYVNDVKTDSTKYSAGQIAQTYGGLEPRVNLRFALNDASSIKASVARTYQYLHLVSNNGSTLPTDVWVPSTAVVKPEIAWQYAAGYFRNFLNNILETSVEVYYKTMENQIEYRANYVPNTIKDPELDYVFGKGTAYGAEFFVNKTQGKFTGWIGYTLSWTTRQFNALNNGEAFPAKYDRRHDISVVGAYQFNKKWSLSSVFVYGSGNTITLPTGFYFINGSISEVFSKINAYRLPSYHRLDVSAVYTPQHKRPRKWQSSWAFSVYNIYDHQNPYFLYADVHGSVQSGVTEKIYQVTIFPIIPSITYNFKF
ncbi:MAG: TonB-dependent receptor [Taibaiella sp.]|nr:TonB-dependent receptor [Taibaiella sp.]